MLEREDLRIELRRRVPLPPVVAEAVVLHRDGGRLRGACPAHPDPLRGLTVDEVTGSYHCFSCGRGGDVVRWMMEEGRMTEGKAMEALAVRAGSL